MPGEMEKSIKAFMPLGIQLILNHAIPCTYAFSLLLVAFLISGCGEAAEQLAGPEVVSEVTIRVTLPEGQQLVHTFSGASSSELGLAGDFVRLAQGLVEHSASGAAATVEYGGRLIRIEPTEATSDNEYLCPLIVVLPDAAERLAERAGFVRKGDRPEVPSSLQKLIPTSCTVTYSQGHCAAGPGMGTVSGCRAQWTCTDGSTGCTPIDPVHC